MTIVPPVRYVDNGDVTLAYQIVGSGRDDLLYLVFETPSVVGNWLVPDHARFMEELSSFSRLIVTDRRGMGCSDRLPAGESPTLEAMVDDLLVVMEAAHVGSATILAGQETAFVAMLAAATHPDRFDGLVLYGASPSWRRSDEMPWQPSEDRWRHNLGVIRRVTDLHAWAEVFVRDTAPSLTGDPEAISVQEALSALAGTPRAWFVDQRMFSEIDLTHLVPSIRVPTLLLHRTEDPVEPIDSARLMADRLPDARLVELPGRDRSPWIGHAREVIDEIRAFMTGDRRPVDPERALTTLLFTDIVASTERAAELGDLRWRDLLASHHRLVREQLAAHGGTEVDTTGDGFLATFDGPARAVRCAQAICAGVLEVGIEIRAGLHTGEVERVGGDLRGIAVHIGARVASAAAPSEVLTTSTVKDLVAGSGLVFEDVGEHELKGVPDRWHLYRAVRPEEGSGAEVPARP